MFRFSGRLLKNKHDPTKPHEAARNIGVHSSIGINSMKYLDFKVKDLAYMNRNR